MTFTVSTLDKDGNRVIIWKKHIREYKDAAKIQQYFQAFYPDQRVVIQATPHTEHRRRRA